MKYDDEAPMELLRWVLAERFKWTLGEVDALSLGDLGDFFQIEDARGKVSKRNG